MNLLPAGLQGTDFHDLFVEANDSISVEWKDDQVIVRRGLRSGAGLRRLVRPRTLFFHALDDPAPERLAWEIRRIMGGDRIMGGEMGPARRTFEGNSLVAGALIDSCLAGGGRGEERLASEAASTAGPGTPARAGLPRAVSADARAGNESPGWEPEIVSLTRWVESVRQHFREEVGSVHGAEIRLEAGAHLYRQSIQHETPDSVVVDTRQGVRVELRACDGGRAVLERRAAARRVGDLTERCSAADLGVELGRGLLGRRGRRAHPDGIFTVVLASEGCGAFLHEIGHLFEEDDPSDSRGCPREGERVAAPTVTLTDDAQACSGRGSYRVDDEGMPPGRALLVKDGRAVGTLRTAAGHKAAGTQATGHGRRGSYREPPMARMACTVLAAGLEDPGAIVSGTPRGLFVRSMRVGSVEPISGRITLVATEGFLIEGGRLTDALAECFLIAGGREFLAAIDALGNDLRFDHGSGNCLKSGQNLPVMVGMPTVRVGGVRVLAP